MKKIVLLFAICLVLSLSITVFASAEEAGAVAGAPVTETPGTETTEAPAEEVPLSTFVSDFIGENAAEILSAVSVVVSAVIVFLFKKGLLPTVSALFGKIGDKTEEVSSAATKAAETAKDISEKAQKAIDEMSEKFAEYEGKSDKKLELYGEIISIQTQMIGNLMLNLRLSPDQRAAVESAMQEIAKKTTKEE